MTPSTIFMTATIAAVKPPCKARKNTKFITVNIIFGILFLLNFIDFSFVPYGSAAHHFFLDTN